MEPITESATSTEKPAVVSQAVLFLYLSLLIGLLAAIVRVAQLVSGAALFIALGVALIFYGIYFFIIRTISNGRNWARIMLLVLVIIGLPFVIPSYIAELKGSLFMGLAHVIVLLLQLVGTGLLFTGNSNRWFRSR